MSVSEPLARLAVRSVEDLVGLVPYLIGFHPQESLVVMVLEEGRVVVTARVDLDAVRDATALDDLLGRLFGRFPAAEGWFLAYTDDGPRAWDVLAGCVEQVGLSRLGRVLHVGPEQWRADCPDGPTGPLLGTSAAAAQAAVLGLPARASRADLAVGIAGPPDREVEALLAEFGVRAQELERIGPGGCRRLLKRLLTASLPLQTADCVRLALLVARPQAQLTALRTIRQRNADVELQRWTQVVRHSLTAYRAPVLGLLGVAAWQTGDGALQVVCLEQLDLIDPLEPMAALLDWLNVNVVPPHEWEQLREPLLRSLEEQVRDAPAGPLRSRRHT